MKSFFSTPFEIKYLPPGELTVILPAGEIWSVVIESPNNAKTFAPVISSIFGNY